MKNSKLCFVLLFFSIASIASITVATVSAQDLSQNDTYAQTIVSQTVAEDTTISDRIVTLERAAKNSPTPSDQRSLYAFIASLQEQAGRYSDATASYAIAAGIDSSSAYGMPSYTAEQLAINAVRCALSDGNYQLARTYLESEVQHSTDPKVAPYVKLYKVWAMIGEADSTDEIFGEPAALLQNYAKDKDMEIVRPTVLLMLWAVTNDSESGKRLVSEYPSSPEAAIVSGKSINMPTPFWFFLPQSGTNAFAHTDATPQPAQTNPQIADVIPQPSVTRPSVTPSQSTPTTTYYSPSVPRKVQQTGVFSKRDNARTLVSQLAAKGFQAEITEEYRTVKGVSGNYFVVTVEENANGTMGRTLRDAGFDCMTITRNN